MRHRFDIVMAWSVDRLGRSLKDLVGFLQHLHDLNVQLYLHQQALDTTTSAGRMLFQLLGVFAKFERSMIVERVRSGLAKARAKARRAAGLSDDHASRNGRCSRYATTTRQAAFPCASWPKNMG